MSAQENKIETLKKATHFENEDDEPSVTPVITQEPKKSSFQHKEIVRKETD